VMGEWGGRRAQRPFRASVHLRLCGDYPYISVTQYFLYEIYTSDEY